jgi:hypothetical protein
MSVHAMNEFNSAGPIDIVRGRLTADDDVRLWEAALSLLTVEFLRHLDEQPRARDCVFQVGVCSHWVRPHQTRWTAGGGFAYPEGYQNSLPAFDWYVLLSYQESRWLNLEKLPSKRSMIFRAAIPARTAKHAQAVIHTKWSNSECSVFYGFRKKGDIWSCVAASDQEHEGLIAPVVEN